MKDILHLPNGFPPNFASLITDAIANGFDHCFTMTRRGFLAGGIYHRTIELFKEFEIVDHLKVFNVQLYATPFLNGYYITERLLPTN